MSKENSAKHENQILTRRIIDETLRLYKTQSIKFTMDEIAKNLCISKKTIYKHFANKEVLIIKCIDTIFEDIYEKHKLIIEEDLDPLNKLRKILVVYPTIYDVDNFNIDELNSLRGAIRRIEFHLKNNWETTFEILQECKDNKIIRDIDNEYFRIIMVGLFKSCLEEENNHYVLEKCIDYVFEGLYL